MTTALTVLTKPKDGARLFDVVWSTGRQMHGLVTVDMRCDTEANDVAAELSAMQYLLEERAVCGHDRAGKSLQLTCSFGAVRKLVAGRSTKPSLIPFALFLRTRFADASIVVSKDEQFIRLDRATKYADRLTVTSPLLSAFILSDGLRVGLTQHALNAYMARYQNAVPSDAWRALRAAAQDRSTRLERATPAEVSRYGKGVRAYASPHGLRLIVVEGVPAPRIVTCYYSRSAARRVMEMHTA